MGAHQRLRVTVRLGAALLLSVAVTGCGGQTVVTEGSATLLVHNRSLLPRGGTDALIEGMLTSWNGCVGLASVDEPTRVLVAIWPRGTELDDDDPLAVRLPSGTLVAQGQKVRGAGGYSAPDSGDFTVDIPAACDLDSDEVAVFNPDDDPVVVE